VTALERRVRVRVEEDLHRQSDGSTVSTAATAFRNSASSSADLDPIR